MHFLSQKRALLIWCATTLFFNFQYYLRSIPNTMGDILQQEFGMTPSLFGMFSSSYYFFYALVLIPAGLALDYYGPKLVLRLGSTLCLIGCVMFAVASDYTTLIASRCLFSIGAATAFIGSIRMSALWIPPTHMAFVSGMTSGVGKMGGAGANMLIPYYMDRVNSWRDIIVILSCVSLAIALFMWTLAKNGPEDKFTRTDKHFSLSHIMQNIKEVVSIPTLWFMGLYGYTMTLSLNAFSDSFSIPFLTKRLMTDYKVAGNLSALVGIGSALGSIVLTYTSDRLSNRRIVLLLSALMTVVLSTFIFFGPMLSVTTMGLCLFFFGLFSGGQVMAFIVTGDCVPKRLLGLSVAVINTFVMMGGAIHNPLIAFLKGSKTSLESYTWPLMSIYVCFLLAGVIAWTTKETYPKKTTA